MLRGVPWPLDAKTIIVCFITCMHVCFVGVFVCLFLFLFLFFLWFFNLLMYLLMCLFVLWLCMFVSQKLISLPLILALSLFCPPFINEAPGWGYGEKLINWGKENREIVIPCPYGADAVSAIRFGRENYDPCMMISFIQDSTRTSEVNPLYGGSTLKYRFSLFLCLFISLYV